MQCNVIHICSVSTFLICSIIFYLFSRVAINLLVGRMLARAARLRCQGPQIARGRGWPRELVISSKFWSLGMCQKWVWVNTYRYIFSGMNIHLPAILGFTRYQGFDPSPNGMEFQLWEGSHAEKIQRVHGADWSAKPRQ